MFCPQCGHQQVSNETKFCSKCGVALGLGTDLLINSSQQLQREKREMVGIGFMMATVLMLINFIFVFGIVTLPHLTNRVFLWIWLSFLIASLSTGGVGLANLIRGGFFKKLKERELRLNLMKLEQARQQLPQPGPGDGIEVEPTRRLVEPASIAEGTTRELQAVTQPGGEHTKETSRVEKP